MQKSEDYGQLYRELIGPKNIVRMSHDGSKPEVFAVPPSTIELRAARAIKRLVERAEGLEKALATLQKHGVEQQNSVVDTAIEQLYNTYMFEKFCKELADNVRFMP